MERGGDRAALHADRGGDRVVVEVGVVPQEEHEPLPLGQGGDGRAQLGPLVGVAVRRRLRGERRTAGGAGGARPGTR